MIVIEVLIDCFHQYFWRSFDIGPIDHDTNTTQTTLFDQVYYSLIPFFTIPKIICIDDHLDAIVKYFLHFLTTNVNDSESQMIM